MDKYKLHPSGWGSLSNETEVYCELYNLKLTETVSSLDGMKNVYFMPSTEFPRADFKKYYPNVNIRRVLKNIDCVIFDNNTAEPTRVFVEEGGKYNPSIFRDTKNKLLYTKTKVLGNSFYTNKKTLEKILVDISDYKKNDAKRFSRQELVKAIRRSSDTKNPKVMRFYKSILNGTVNSKYA
jgi:hypothetical protein